MKGLRAGGRLREIPAWNRGGPRRLMRARGWEMRRKSWTGYAAIPKFLRCSTGLREPSEILIRASLYQRR